MNHRPIATLRLARVDDGPGVAAVYAPYCDTTAVSFETSAPSPVEMARRITVFGAERPWLVLEEGDDDRRVVLGYAYATPHNERAAYRWSVNTAVYVSTAHRRRGVGRALYTTLFEALRHLGYVKATAGITLPNPASVGLHEAFGFTPMGVYRDIGFKFGGWHDVAWYQAQIQPTAPNPAPPRPMSALTGAAWDDAVAGGLAHYVNHP